MASVSLEYYKEKIRMKYLEEGHTQSQILEWLNDDQLSNIRYVTSVLVLNTKSRADNW